MKRVLKCVAVMGLLISAINISSCKKDGSSTTPGTPTDETEQQMTAASDESDVTSESDEAVMDANVAITKSQFSGGLPGDIKEKIEGGETDIDEGNKTISIKFDGKTKGKCGRLREGSMVVKLTNGLHWNDKGSEITITFKGYKVHRHCGGKERVIIFDGTKTVTNIHGGHFCFMKPGDSIVYEVKGSSQISFDGKVATWNLSRRMTFTMRSDFVKRVTIEGTGPNNDVVWGTDRYGREFEVAITQAVKRNNKCGYDEATSGVKVYRKLPHEATVTFGVDKDGTPVTAEDCSAYGYKVSWINAEGKAVSYVKPYDD